MFEARGGQLTRSANFGIDPLIQRVDLYESRLTLCQRNAPPPSDSLRESLRLFYNITLNLANNF